MEIYYAIYIISISSMFLGYYLLEHKYKKDIKKLRYKMIQEDLNNKMILNELECIKNKKNC